MLWIAREMLVLASFTSTKCRGIVRMERTRARVPSDLFTSSSALFPLAIFAFTSQAVSVTMAFVK